MRGFSVFIHPIDSGYITSEALLAWDSKVPAGVFSDRHRLDEKLVRKAKR